MFAAVLNDKLLLMYPNEMEIEDDVTISAGYLSGPRIFANIEPGETEVIRYGLGGIVTSGRLGTGAKNNHVTEAFKREGIHEGELRFEFAVVTEEAKKRTSIITTANYEDFNVVQSSNTVDVHLKTYEGFMDNDEIPCPLDYDLVEEMKEKLM